MAFGFLGAVPWNLNLNTAPTLVSSARLLFETLSKGNQGADKPAFEEPEVPYEPTAVIDELRARLDELAVNDTKQAELASRIAAQQEALSLGLRAVSTRVAVLVWLAGLALVLASSAVVIALLR